MEIQTAGVFAAYRPANHKRGSHQCQRLPFVDEKWVHLPFITGSTASAFIRPQGEKVRFQLPREIVPCLTNSKNAHGLRDHGRALVQLIEQG
jgi:hypothetical protein